MFNSETTNVPISWTIWILFKTDLAFSQAFIYNSLVRGVANLATLGGQERNFSHFFLILLLFSSIFPHFLPQLGPRGLPFPGRLWLRHCLESQTKLTKLKIWCSRQTCSINTTNSAGWIIPRNLKGGIGSLFDPCVNGYGAVAILPITYGGELLYLQIWRHHSAQYAHIMVTAWFNAR